MRLTQEQWAEAHRLRETAGLGVGEIAAQFGVTEDTVRRHADKDGWLSPPGAAPLPPRRTGLRGAGTAVGRRQLIKRLYKAMDTKLRLMERRMETQMTNLNKGSVIYTGPDEWSYRRFILHYAHLALAAGGVDAFIIGSEMRGLTQVRDSASHYPFVAALATLAADVKTVLGPSTKVVYAADWSEYFGHQPADGTGDVHFDLDPLWASAAIDAVGIDVYPAFPANSEAWGDSGNWRLGHWITGRLAAAPLAATVSAILEDYGFTQHDAMGGDS